MGAAGQASSLTFTGDKGGLLPESKYLPRSVAVHQVNLLKSFLRLVRCERTMLLTAFFQSIGKLLID